MIKCSSDMPRIFLTNHGRNRLKKRWPNKQVKNWFSLVLVAWNKGRLLNDDELIRMFNRGVAHAERRFMLEYRVLDNHIFVFERRDNGDLSFVTLFKETKPRLWQRYATSVRKRLGVNRTPTT